MSQPQLNNRMGLAGLILIGILGMQASYDQPIAHAESQKLTQKPAAQTVPREVKQPKLTPQQRSQREAALKELGMLVLESGDLVHPIDLTVQKVHPFLKYPDSQVRQEAIRVFHRMGSALSAKHVGYLTPLLNDADIEVKIVAIYALAEMKAHAKSVVPTLKAMRRNPDLEMAAQWGLQNIDTATRSKRLQELLQQLQSSNPKAPRYHAVLELGYMYPIEIQPQLRKLLQHSNSEVRKDAESVLGAIDQYAQRKHKLLNP
ncbi:MAG: HEAT repeat domain-containing protein [Synechococcales bacterium]|nr:HEAT repeat domain-containing protein [Synechococcales bacterium]